MSNFLCESVEDLVFNKSFREWVLDPESRKNSFWESWVKQNPQHAEIINQSKAIIFALQINLKGLSDEAIHQEINKILYKLQQSEAPLEQEETFGKNGRFSTNRRLFPFSVAAAFLLFTLGYFFLFRTSKTPSMGYETFLAGSDEKLTENRNTSAGTRILTLPDGSRVHLEGNSKLRHSTNFLGKRREVYLVGEAFFDIKKDPSRPFLVYTNNLITKVLGTSFRVKAFADNRSSIVTVRTGKVSVYRSENFSEELLNSKVLSGTILTPNQELIFSPKSKEVNKTIIQQPKLDASISETAFIFDETPINKVFSTMEMAYNIPIVYDEEILMGCSLSAKLGNEPFYEKLQLICKAINASYEMIDGQIVVSSNGCK